MTLTVDQFQEAAIRWLARLKETGKSLLLLSGQDVCDVRPFASPSTAPVLRNQDSIPKASIIAGDPEDIVHLDWSSEWRP